MKQAGFNPKARWDRNIPQTDEDYLPSGLNQKIEVLAYFKQSKIFPRGFSWKNKYYKVKEITYNWQERQGQEIISYFSVDTGIGLYQISFNNTSFGWRLDKVLI